MIRWMPGHETGIWPNPSKLSKCRSMTIYELGPGSSTNHRNQAMMQSAATVKPVRLAISA